MPKRSSPICCRLSFATLLLLLMTQPAMTQESKTVTLELDHVSICGSNLDTLRQAFTDVGMTPDFGGPHGNGITQMLGRVLPVHEVYHPTVEGTPVPFPSASIHAMLAWEDPALADRLYSAWTSPRS